MWRIGYAFVLLMSLLGAGCGGAPSAYKPLDAEHVLFWDRQTSESATLLRELVAEFNGAHPGLPVKVERAGGYAEIYRKVSASIQMRKLPAMAVSYESMTSEYVPTGAVLALDDFVAAEPGGFSKEELEDFFPAVLETNRYGEYGGRMYSFPFAKSVLLMYFNKRVLAEAGVEAGPPDTWDAFVAQCRQVRERTGKYGYAVSVDCSTVNGMIFSMGGEVMREGKMCYDAPESVAVFEMLALLAREKLAYQVSPGTFEDNVALVNDAVAFTFRSSSSLSALKYQMKGREEDWGVAPIPQGKTGARATVLFGPNVSVFTTNQTQQERAWSFVKFFVSKEVMVRWALGTGYLPFRKSVAKDARLQAEWAKWPYNRVSYDCLSFARPEPNVVGWQEIRDLVCEAEVAVLTGTKTGKEAALALQAQATQVLARSH